MKTPEETLAIVSTMIVGMHHRPAIYVGETSQAGTANAVDGMFWIAHSFWAAIQNRDEEFRRIHGAVADRHDSGCWGFPNSFRRTNPTADDESVFRFVVRCWREIDEGLGMDLTWPPVVVTPSSSRH